MGNSKLQKTGSSGLEWRRWPFITDQVDVSVIGDSADCVHNKREINHGLESGWVVVAFGGRVELNDSKKLQGV